MVALARGWIGTPYLHQASLKGVGADCLGLLRGVWREAYGHEPEAVPAYTPDWSEPSGDEALWRAAARHLPLVAGNAPIEAGQVLLFRMHAGSVAKHLGIAAGAGDDRRFIHAYTGHGVIESPLSEPWRRRIAVRFRFQ